MRGIIDPDLGRDIVTLGFIKDLNISDDGDVTFLVELTTPACPVKDQFRDACQQAVSAIAWVKQVHVTMSAQKGREPMGQTSAGLSQVNNIIAVASCKGGVGKSTVAVNLAFAMAQRGANVGIFDADIFGPSLATMVKIDFKGLYQDAQERIIPVERNGVKLMSFAFASSKRGEPAVMRGPMVTNVINQLISTTSWGELDYLVIDMPPGTGDIQLTLSQVIPMTAAVIVTTPQEISFVDVVKGIKMFDMMKVPTVAVVENMSYFICENCDTKHEFFGAGALRKLVEQFGFENTVSLPVDPQVSAHCDSGQPLVLEDPKTAASKRYFDLADIVVREISKLLYSESTKPEVRHVPGEGILVNVDSDERVISPAVLRRHCRCAQCVSEMTGKKVLRDEDIPENIAPEEVSPMGNYAITVSWSDGHSSIYPYDTLKNEVPALTAN